MLAPPDPRSEREKMIAGELYVADDPELLALRERGRLAMVRYNAENDLAALRDIFAHLGERAKPRAPFFFEYGFNISIGDRTFLNFNCVLLDVTPIRIGDDCQIGPNVQFYAADHPRDPAVRPLGREFGRPITVGNNVWIGGGSILLPGITIGDDAILGAGSVVTRDVPAGATAVGNPARVR